MGFALILAGAAIIPLMLRSANLGSTRPARPNVLLITIDTLRWDRLGSYGAAHNPTPVLDRLAARGTRFETAIAHVPLTAPSHASILTGLTPVRHGVRDNGAFVLTEKITLASTFRAAGYATGAFVSGFPLDRRFGFAAGFQTYDDRLPGSDGPGRAAYTERRADDTTERALAWLAASAGNRPSSSGAAPPWFLWIHYFDPHAAYDPPQPWKGKMPTAYDGEVAFVDDQIGRLFGKLAQMGAESQTIVAVTADHGESLGAHNEETHGVFIYDATLRVPLIVAGPGISAGSVPKVVGRGVDVMPTLVDVAGLQVPEHLDGRSLKLALEGRTMDDEGTYVESLLAERQFGWAALRGFRDSRWKYIDAPEPELSRPVAGCGRDEEPRDRRAATGRHARGAAGRGAQGRWNHRMRYAAKGDDGSRSSRTKSRRNASESQDRDPAGRSSGARHRTGPGGIRVERSRSFERCSPMIRG